MPVLATAVSAEESIQVAETTIVGLLVVAALVAIAVSYLRLPYTVALVGVGLFLGFGGAFETGLELDHDLILLVFLPPLLFEGAINMDLDDLRRRWAQVGVLAFVGTGVVVSVIGSALHYLGGLAWPFAVMLGVILAPTDPVSVLAIFKEHGVSAGLRTLLEGESIFNDALSIVVFLIASEVALGDGGVTVPGAVFEFGAEVLIGVGAGALVGFVAHRLMGTLDNHLVETTLSLATAFGAYLVADQTGGSGVIATVTAGLLIGNYGTAFAMSAQSRLVLTDFWEVVAFMANSLLFLLMGVAFDVATLADGRVLTVAGIGIGAVLVSRAIVTGGVMAPFGADPDGTGIPRAWRPAIFWGGLRGAIPIALVLGLAPADRVLGGVDAVPVVFSVVLFSLLVQGTTFRPLLSRLGLIGHSEDAQAYEEALARTLALRASQAELERLARRGEVSRRIHRELVDDIGRELEEAEIELDELAVRTDVVRTSQVQRTARRLAAAQRAELAEAGRRGQLSDRVVAEYSERIERALQEGEIAPTLAAELGPGLFPDEDDGADPV
jgi:monovalent cation:H+ antiporter, CPA1 family